MMHTLHAAQKAHLSGDREICDFLTRVNLWFLNIG